MSNAESTSTITPTIGNRASLQITTFVMGTIVAVNADESVLIQIDETIRAVKLPGPCFPGPSWIEAEDEG